MHADRLAITDEVAQHLVAEQFPHLATEPVRRLAASGTENTIFRIGRGSTARFPLRMAPLDERARQLRAAGAAMHEFARHSTVPCPQPLGQGEPGPGFPSPWMLQSWVDGEVATPEGSENSEALAADLSGLIVALRRADTFGRKFSGSGRGGQLPDHDAWMAECLSRSEGLLDVDTLGQLWAVFRQLPPGGPDVLSHGDLIPANLLVRDGRLVGVLDTGGFGPADPALDLVCAWHLLDRPRRDRLRDILGCDDTEWVRGAAWAFQQAMGLVWYYQTSNPPMSALGRSTLGRLLSDPEIRGIVR